MRSTSRAGPLCPVASDLSSESRHCAKTNESSGHMQPSGKVTTTVHFAPATDVTSDTQLPSQQRISHVGFEMVAAARDTHGAAHIRHMHHQTTAGITCLQGQRGDPKAAS